MQFKTYKSNICRILLSNFLSLFSILTDLRPTFLTLTILLLSISSSFAQLSPRTCPNNYSWGHKIGAGVGECHSELPENSLVALKAALVGREGEDPATAIQHERRFGALEFDIRETIDGHIVLMHDEDLGRMVPDVSYNVPIFRLLSGTANIRRRNTVTPRQREFVRRTQLRLAEGSKTQYDYSKIKINRLTLNELKMLRLLGHPDYVIPTIEEVLTMAKELKLVRPITVDIKKLETDAARFRLLQMMKTYRLEYAWLTGIQWRAPWFGIGMITNPSGFIASFATNTMHSLQDWCNFFKADDFPGIYNYYNPVNLCVRGAVVDNPNLLDTPITYVEVPVVNQPPEIYFTPEHDDDCRKTTQIRGRNNLRINCQRR